MPAMPRILSICLCICPAICFHRFVVSLCVGHAHLRVPRLSLSLSIYPSIAMHLSTYSTGTVEAQCEVEAIRRCHCGGVQGARCAADDARHRLRHRRNGTVATAVLLLHAMMLMLPLFIVINLSLSSEVVAGSYHGWLTSFLLLLLLLLLLPMLQVGEMVETLKQVRGVQGRSAMMSSMLAQGN